ncbi:MAG: hypothetical protein RI973_1268 [Bacteroidota bacterium]|jgi:hypothetical protein
MSVFKHGLVQSSNALPVFEKEAVSKDPAAIMKFVPPVRIGSREGVLQKALAVGSCGAARLPERALGGPQAR